MNQGELRNARGADCRWMQDLNPRKTYSINGAAKDILLA